MRDWGSITYEWLRDHGQVIGAFISGLFAVMLFSLGWHVRREQKWRDHVEQQLATIMPKAEIVKAIDQVIADRNAQVASINARIDGMERRLEKRLEQQTRDRAEHLRLVRGDIERLGSRVELLIARAINQRDKQG